MASLEDCVGDLYSTLKQDKTAASVLFLIALKKYCERNVITKDKLTIQDINQIIKNIIEKNNVLDEFKKLLELGMGDCIIHTLYTAKEILENEKTWKQMALNEKKNSLLKEIKKNSSILCKDVNGSEFSTAIESIKEKRKQIEEAKNELEIHLCEADIHDGNTIKFHTSLLVNENLMFNFIAHEKKLLPAEVKPENILEDGRIIFFDGPQLIFYKKKITLNIVESEKEKNEKSLENLTEEWLKKFLNINELVEVNVVAMSTLCKSKNNETSNNKNISNNKKNTSNNKNIGDDKNTNDSEQIKKVIITNIFDGLKEYHDINNIPENPNYTIKIPDGDATKYEDFYNFFSKHYCLLKLIVDVLNNRLEENKVSLFVRKLKILLNDTDVNKVIETLDKKDDE